MRLIHLPVEGPRAAGVVLGLDQEAVGHDAKRAVNGDDHLRRGTIVGIVVAGKPEVVVLGFSLGPDRLRLFRRARV